LIRTIGDWEGFYAKRQENFETLKNWYFKQHRASGLTLFGEEPVASVSDRDAVTPINLPTHIVNMAVAMASQETPSIEVLVNQGSNPQRKRGNLAEKVFMGVLHVNGELQGKSLIREFFHNLFLFGWGVVFTGWDDLRVPKHLKSDLQRLVERQERSAIVGDLPGSPDALLDETEPTSDDAWALPVVVDVPHPEQVIAIPGGHRERWKAIFRRMPMTLSDAEDFFGVSVERKTPSDHLQRPAEDDQPIVVYDFWAWVGNRIWHTIFIHGMSDYVADLKAGGLMASGLRELYFIKEPCPMPEYDRLPYEIRFCTPTTDTRPENYGLSLLYPVLDAVEEAEILSNRLAMILDNYADPVYIREYDTNLASSAVPAVIERGPGQTIDVDKGLGQEVRVMQGMGAPPDLDKLREWWLQMAKEWGFDPSIDGTTGLDSIVKKSGMLAKLVVPISEAEKGLAAVHQRVVHLFTHLVRDKSLQVRGEVTVDGSSEAYALDITGSKLKGMGHAKFTIRARFPYEELQNVAAAQALMASGLMSPERIMTQYLFVDDPETELKKIEDYQLRFNKAIDDGLIQMTFQKAQAPPAVDPSAVPPPAEAIPGVQSAEATQAAALTRNLGKGPTPESDMALMGGPMLPTGNAPGQPAPNGSLEQIIGGLS
jgi:hypothetical protein